MKAKLYLELPAGITPELVNRTYHYFLAETGASVDYEGFINGFVWALELIRTAAQAYEKETLESDLRA